MYSLHVCSISARNFAWSSHVLVLRGAVPIVHPTFGGISGNVSFGEGCRPEYIDEFYDFEWESVIVLVIMGRSKQGHLRHSQGVVHIWL